MGSDAEKLYPYSAMQDQFRKFGKFGLYMASLLLPMMTADAEATPDLDALAEDMHNDNDKISEIFKSEESDNRFAKRLGGVFYDMDRLGYL